MRHATTLFAGALVVSVQAHGSVQPTVDAIAAATINTTCAFVLPFSVTATGATVRWTEGHTDGAGVICHGTVDPPASCRDVTAAERAATSLALSGLQPATRYYVRYEVSKPGETSYAATGSFTTATSAVLEPAAGKAGCTWGTLMAGDEVTVSDVRGRLVSRRVVGRDGTMPALPTPTAAIYILRVSRQGSAVSPIAAAPALR